MKKFSRISAIVVLVLALSLLAFTQWVPALLILPVAGGLYALDPAMRSPYAAPVKEPPNRRRTQ